MAKLRRGDGDLFRQAMRGVKPLARVKPPGISALPKPAAVARLAPPRPSAPLPKAAKPLEIGQSDGIDRASF